MKVIRHSHHEQFLRLGNDDAALLVSSGRWVYTSKFEARKVTQRQRPLWLRIGMLVTTLAMIATALLLSTSARAADLKVPKLLPYQACLTQAQAAQVYKGKRLKYREVGKERCWYAGATLPKHAFMSSRGGKVAGAIRNRDVAHAERLDGVGEDSTRGSIPRADGVATVPREANPRATEVAVAPTRTIIMDAQRVQGPLGLIPSAGASLTEMAEDAFLALTGRPEAYWTFDAYWDRMTGWNR